MGIHTEAANDLERRLEDIENKVGSISGTLSAHGARLDELEKNSIPVAGPRGWPEFPPNPIPGMIRYWEIAASTISENEKVAWNSTGIKKGFEFTTSRANQTVSDKHFTGLYYPEHPMKFENGRLTLHYKGYDRPTRWLNMNYVWQPGKWPADRSLGLFVPSWASDNNLQTAKDRAPFIDIEYSFGFDFRFEGIEDSNAPGRVPLWFAKSYQNENEQDYTTISWCPRIGVHREPGGSQQKLLVQLVGDSDVVTARVEDLEVNAQWWSQMPIKNHSIYRVRCAIKYAKSSNGHLKVELEDLNADRRETVVDKKDLTTWMATDRKGTNYELASRGHHFGTYITGSGTGSSPITLEMDNLYFDREIPAD